MCGRGTGAEDDADRHPGHAAKPSPPLIPSPREGAGDRPDLQHRRHRIDRYTTAGERHQCTLDDSIFGSDWELQLRLSEVVEPTGLIEYTSFEQRQVMDRALGEQLATPHLWEVPVQDRDLLLAVSDGVTDNLTFSELRRPLHGDRDGPDQIAHRLVDPAYARSDQTGHPRAKIDDITAVAAQVRYAPPT